MTKKKKIVFSIIAVLLLIYFLPIFGLEKSVIKNEIAKSTREPVLGKNPVVHLISTINSKKKIDFVDEKNVSHYVKEKDIEKIKQEKKSNIFVQESLGYMDVSRKDLRNIGLDHSDVYLEFTEKGGDATYFKPDFKGLFEKKVGDKVTLVFDNIEYEGYIHRIETDGNDFKNITITPEICSDNNEEVNCYDNTVSVAYFGDNIYNGNINYTDIVGGVNYSFEANNGIGIIVPTFEYEMFLGPIVYD